MGHRKLLRHPVLRPGMNIRDSLNLTVLCEVARFDRHCSKARQGAVIGCG